ncbi:MAG: GIY-YIG nuclease family protein [Bacteroidota bacterium]
MSFARAGPPDYWFTLGKSVGQGLPSESEKWMKETEQHTGTQVYVLRSLVDQKRYIGISDGTPERLVQHNAGKVIATKSRRPFVLTFTERCATRKEARALEKYFKTGAGRRFLDKVETPTWLEFLKKMRL